MGPKRVEHRKGSVELTLVEHGRDTMEGIP